jgi:hypothetical protein
MYFPISTGEIPGFFLTKNFRFASPLFLWRGTGEGDLSKSQRNKKVGDLNHKNKNKMNELKELRFNESNIRRHVQYAVSENRRHDKFTVAKCIFNRKNACIDILIGKIEIQTIDGKFDISKITGKF